LTVFQAIAYTNIRQITFLNSFFFSGSRFSFFAGLADVDGDAPAEAAVKFFPSDSRYLLRNSSPNSTMNSRSSDIGASFDGSKFYRNPLHYK
jgi:hypothetical protein